MTIGNLYNNMICKVIYVARGMVYYLQYENKKDLLNVILYMSQSFMAITPMLYHITFKDREILFVHIGIVGGVVAPYHILKEKPSSKFVELNKMTADFKFTEAIGNNNQCIYPDC
ncbi:MAG: hypothetical protein L0H55_13295 [Candidatus Nitrosocosmicus sp.]|nr:hypothetical protein [Candidatus Nitrosocosmicus sp.]